MKQKCYHFDNIFVTDGDHRKLSAFGAAMITISLKWWHFRLNQGSNNKHFFMMTSSNGNIFRITGPLSGEFTDHRWIPLTKPVTRSFGIFFDLRPNKRLSKQARRRWFKAPSCSLWRHRNWDFFLLLLLITWMAMPWCHAKTPSKCRYLYLN